MEARLTKEIGVCLKEKTLQTKSLKLHAKKLPKQYSVLRQLILNMPDRIGAHEYIGWSSALLKLMDFCDGYENRNNPYIGSPREADSGA